MASNTSFVFYKSFYDAMQFLNNDDKCDFISLICDLAFNGVEADFTNSGYSDLVKMLYTVSAEQIKASIQHKNDGLKGGRPKKEDIEKGVKTPLLTPLKTNVNVNVKDNVKVNENVNVNDTTLTLSQKKDLLITCCKKYGFTLEDRAINKIIKHVYINYEEVYNSHLEYVFNNYGDKSDDEKRAIFYKSFLWSDLDPLEPAQKPKTKNIKSIDYSLAPKKCECGASVTPWGVPNSVKCVACSKTWELNNNGLWVSTN